MAKKYYAVKNGKSGDGIYQSWAECEAQVKGAPGVLFKGFATRAEAEAFLQRAGESTTEGDAPQPPRREGVAVAYVDGSYHDATKEFACGRCSSTAARPNTSPTSTATPALADMRNVAGEIMGAVTVIDYCRKAGISALEIHHDYEGVAKWAQGLWKANKPGTPGLCRPVPGGPPGT